MPVRRTPPIRWLVGVLALLGSAQVAGAQDVEMLGRRYGTQPPPGYFQELARNPEAFRFRTGRAEPSRVLAAARSGGSAALRAAGTGPLLLGPRGHVTGTFNVPVLLGQFSDSPAPPYTRDQFRQAYFDAPTGTVSEYYDEVSGGDLNLEGFTRPWVQSPTMSQSGVAQGQSGLVCCGIGDFIKQLIGLQTPIDWGLFDNDGPDGFPNSGDDDGFVDALAVVHPLRGAECGGAGSSSRIWSHKWTLSEASTGGQPYTTSVAGAEGGFIRIEDYFVQGVLSCDQTSLNEIGVFAHETGHAFGLPDLYDTSSAGTLHGGAGNWELMAHGTWGCDDRTPAWPCHMGAWSKAMLGWVDVTTLAPDTDHGTLTLPPVETSSVVYRVDAADGSGEYFLIENRQRIGYDAGSPSNPGDGLFEEGVLIWQIDANAVAARWPTNEVNASSHMGVWLRQADGVDQLGTLIQYGGDAGDPFPGASGNTAFHTASNPASTSFLGTPSGLTMVNIASAGGDDMAFRALTRFTRLTVRPSGSTSSGLFLVDGASLSGPPPHVVVSPPFTNRTIEAAIGEIVAPGERRPFTQWTDAPSAPRVRIVTTPLVDTDYEAAYGGIQYQLDIPLNGGINGVAPGTVTTTPPSSDLWFAPSTSVDVSITARTGFAFLAWTGALAGQPNPTSVTMSAPIFAGADFQLTYAAADVDLAISAAVAQDIQLVATNGTDPITWSVVSGSLPAGIVMSTSGRLTGAALAAGVFPVTVQALDFIGLTTQATIAFDVTEPAIAIEGLTSRFLLSGPALDPLLEAYVDHQGNGNGSYDLGDFRAWVLAHPSLPLSAAVTAAPQPSVVTIPMRAAPKDGPR